MSMCSLSLSSDDEANICPLIGKTFGCQEGNGSDSTNCLYNLIQGGSIDIVVSPQQATISALLGHVRKGDVKNVATLRHGIAEAIEIVAHGDESTSNVVGRKIGELRLPYGDHYWCFIAR